MLTCTRLHTRPRAMWDSEAEQTRTSTAAMKPSENFNDVEMQKIGEKPAQTVAAAEAAGGEEDLHGIEWTAADA